MVGQPEVINQILYVPICTVVVHNAKIILVYTFLYVHMCIGRKRIDERNLAAI